MAQPRDEGSSLLLSLNHSSNHGPSIQESVQISPSHKRSSFCCQRPERLWSTSIVALAAALSPLVGGYALGYPSSSLINLSNMTHNRSLVNGSVLVDTYGALVPFGALFGGAMAGFSADTLGRKPTIIIALLPYFVGWILLGISWFINNSIAFKVIILVGRFITGFGAGWATLVAPVYVGEVSAPSLRGFYSSLPQLLLNVGIFLIYCIAVIPGIEYYQTAFIAAGMSCIAFLIVIWLPETPRFLIAKENFKKALKVLVFLRGPTMNAQEEIAEIEGAIAKQKKLSCIETLREMRHRSVYLPFILMLMVMFFQQFSGINTIAFYGEIILKDAGLSQEMAKYMALLSIGLCPVIFTLPTVLTVDLVGRKILLMASALIMGFSSYGLGLFNRYENLNILGIVSMICFEFGFSIGYGPIPWIMIAEMIPLRVRGQLGGILVGFSWGCAALITGFYFVYVEYVGADYAWWTFGFLNIASFAFVAFFLPETKGKKLEVMEKQFLNNYKLCSYR
ncbi:PREDICTED: facilitated trehalose transporter Tret1-like [Amphimedon queenslandica]|uniref:Major facilitator superfamily (MFS) profile domain-containing protein n=1 Tax=Amphimedon queenslandica TaxID=400682 RepID=A0AAN0IHV4_AMPQE|nr:PREDICTED: facilitated trehalose transporter Tret1-like [Amphimedon queenslandica]|eukprot:XP_003389392.2 PREDICTED: facilitated trehalose transporter Tret1-like [Amphimedon queenslandica]